MSIPVKCTQCGHLTYVPPARAGKIVRCPGCAAYHGSRGVFRRRPPDNSGMSAVCEFAASDSATGRQDGSLQQVPDNATTIGGTIMILVKCPHCQAAVRKDDLHAGLVVLCPSCKKQVRLPAMTLPLLQQPASSHTPPATLTHGSEHDATAKDQQDLGSISGTSQGTVSAQWYVRVQGKVYGPYSAARLKMMAEEGRIVGDTPVRQGETGQWIVAEKYKGLCVPLPPLPEALPVEEVEEEVLDALPADDPAPRSKHLPANSGQPPRPLLSISADPLRVFAMGERPRPIAGVGPAQPAPASSEKINFACSGCGKAILAPADRAGKAGKCPGCGVTLQIPQTVDRYKGDLMAACAAIGKAAELRDAGEDERANKGFAIAETWVREILQHPCLPFAIEAEANCLLGTCCKSVGRFAEAQTALEKGLALGRSKGLAVMEEWFYADALGDVYDQGVHVLIIEGQLDQAKALLAQVEGFVSHYKSLDQFDWVRHEGFVILARAMIAGNDCPDAAIQHFGQLLRSPYKEYFASHQPLMFVIAQASRNIGQIYHMAYGRSDEAIPYIQESLKYYQPDSEKLANAKRFLRGYE